MIHMKEKRKIYVQTQFEGWHSWKDAPEEVQFLQNCHRHVFHVKVTIDVYHNDREIEFFIFKNDVNTIIKNNVDVKDTGSCEHVAAIIARRLHDKGYTKRLITVEVSEDKENGGVVELYE